MKHLIKRGLGSLKCCAWVALAFGFNLVCLGRVAKTLLRNYICVSMRCLRIATAILTTRTTDFLSDIFVRWSFQFLARLIHSFKTSERTKERTFVVITLSSRGKDI